MIGCVVQEEVSGCGIASVAKILGKIYGEMKAIANGMGIQAEDERPWLLTKASISTAIPSEKTARNW